MKNDFRFVKKRSDVQKWKRFFQEEDLNVGISPPTEWNTYVCA
jgi:hypothetical protein